MSKSCYSIIFHILEIYLFYYRLQIFLYSVDAVALKICHSSLRNRCCHRYRTDAVIKLVIIWSNTCCYTAKEHTHTHIHLTALFPGLPRWAGTRKVEPIWILLKQKRVSGSGISWAICKSALRSRQITTPASHHSVFYRQDAIPAAQPTASKHWRDSYIHSFLAYS